MSTTWRVRRVPHDTLWLLACYHINTIQRKNETTAEAGVSYDCMSAVIALAFSVEAILNFVGERKLKDRWIERDPYPKKIKALETLLGFKYVKTDEPFRTLEELKRTRDCMAHGKPAQLTVLATNRADVAKAMQPEWASVAKPESVLAAMKNVSEFKDLLFKLARIKRGTTFTSATEASV